jgi:integrase
VTRPKTKKSRASVPVIKTLVRMLEAHCVRIAHVKVEAAQRRALQSRKMLDSATLQPEKRMALTQLAASAETLGANPPVAGPIFASGKGTPLNMNNLLNRQILPALRKDGLKDRFGQELWHGFHGFRRGLGTNLKRLGVDLKTIQEILRHSHIATTADIYVKEVSEQAVEAMERLEKHVEAELRKGPKSEPAVAYSAPNLHHGSWAVAPYSE